MAPDETETVPWDRRLRHGMRKYRAALSVVVFVVGIFLTTLALGAFTPLSEGFPFLQLDTYTETPTANYNLIFVIAGPIIFIVGAYLVGAYYLARAKFEHLMLTKSKAEFLRNIPELEQTLWDLTPEDEIRYERKKSDLRVRR